MGTGFYGKIFECNDYANVKLAFFDKDISTGTAFDSAVTVALPSGVTYGMITTISVGSDGSLWFVTSANKLYNCVDVAEDNNFVCTEKG